MLRDATDEALQLLDGDITTLIPKLHDAMGISGFKGPVVEMMHEMIGNPENFVRNPNSVARLDVLLRLLSNGIEAERKYLRAAPTGNISAAPTAPPSAQDEDE